jgi:hypothetical protein
MKVILRAGVWVMFGYGWVRLRSRIRVRVMGVGLHRQGIPNPVYFLGSLLYLRTWRLEIMKTTLVHINTKIQRNSMMGMMVL